MDVASVEAIEVLLGSGSVGSVGLIIYHMIMSGKSHTQITQKVKELESEMVKLKANNMTDQRAREIIHEQLEPVTRWLEKIDSKVDEMPKMYQEMIVGIQQSIATLNTKTAVIDKQIELSKNDRHQNE